MAVAAAAAAGSARRRRHGRRRLVQTMTGVSGGSRGRVECGEGEGGGRLGASGRPVGREGMRVGEGGAGGPVAEGGILRRGVEESTWLTDRNAHSCCARPPLPSRTQRRGGGEPRTPCWTAGRGALDRHYTHHSQRPRGGRGAATLPEPRAVVVCSTRQGGSPPPSSSRGDAFPSDLPSAPLEWGAPLPPSTWPSTYSPEHTYLSSSPPRRSARDAASRICGKGSSGVRSRWPTTCPHRARLAAPPPGRWPRSPGPPPGTTSLRRGCRGPPPPESPAAGQARRAPSRSTWWQPGQPGGDEEERQPHVQPLRGHCQMQVPPSNQLGQPQADDQLTEDP